MQHRLWGEMMYRPKTSLLPWAIVLVVALAALLAMLLFA